MNLSKICVAAAATPQATLAAKSRVDMAPWATGGALALRITPTQVWASRSNTKTSHLRCGVSISMCAPGASPEFEQIQESKSLASIGRYAGY